MVWQCVPWTFRCSSKARGYYSSGKCTHLQNWPLPKQVILTQGTSNVWTMRAVQSPPGIARHDTQKSVQLTTDQTNNSSKCHLAFCGFLQPLSSFHLYQKLISAHVLHSSLKYAVLECCYMHCYLFSFLTYCYVAKLIKIAICTTFFDRLPTKLNVASLHLLTLSASNYTSQAVSASSTQVYECINHLLMNSYLNYVFEE